MRGGLFNPITDLQLVIASLPAHYERDIRWAQKPGARTVLQSPNRLTVNIGNQGYKLDFQVELDTSLDASWDDKSIAAPWQANHAYALNEWVKPTTANNYIYKCTTAGVSGSAEPTWGTAPGGTTNDNTVVWTCYRDYTVAANRAGRDFYVYACQPAGGPTPKFLLSANSTVPAGYTVDNSRKVGGFHCLCVAVGTISGHPLSGYLAGDILPASVWDLKHRPVSSPEGMVFSEAANIWVDIYLQSGTGANTASVYGATITDIRNWMDFVDDAGAVKKRLLNDIEFQLIAAGSNEKTNINGSTDPNTTGGHVDTAGRRMISNIGCEDCCGAMWQWLDEQSYRYDGGSHTHAFTGSALATHTHTENQEASYTQNVQTGATSAGTPAGTNASVDPAPSWAWDTLPGDKGSLYRQGTYGDVKMLAGSGWDAGASSGSRARGLSYFRWLAPAAVGCRGAARRRA